MLYILKYTPVYTHHIWYDPEYTYLKTAVTTKTFNFVFLLVSFLTISCILLNKKRRPYPLIVARLFWGYNMNETKHARFYRSNILFID